MIKKNKISVLMILLFFMYGTAQNSYTTIPIQFKLKFNNTDIVKGKQFVSVKGDTISIDTFKCYISNIKLEFSDNSVSKKKNSFHLLDMDSLNSLKLTLPIKKNKSLTKIRFNIGIDSTTSTSGIQTGVLDPMNGMYWAWQSGYINFKIEGTSSSCKTRNNKFQFHVGGYLFPNYAIREVEFLLKEKNNINIDIDLAQFFNEIDLQKDNTLMIPGKKAMDLANLSIKLFQIK